MAQKLICTELDFQAWSAVYTPHYFGIRRIARLVSGKPIDENDMKKFIILLFEAGWSEKQVIQYLKRLNTMPPITHTTVYNCLQRTFLDKEKKYKTAGQPVL